VVHRYQESQRRTWCSSSPVSPLLAWKFSNRPSLPCDLDQDGQGYWPSFRGVAVVERQVSWV
jgi:hypothetical protein